MAQTDTRNSDTHKSVRITPAAKLKLLEMSSMEGRTTINQLSLIIEEVYKSWKAKQ